MPRLSVWFVRAALAYFLLGSTFGALILAQKGISYYPSVWVLFPVHMDFLLIGWLAQLAMGVAFWIMPRFGRGPARGNVTLVWISFFLLNAGLVTGALQIWLAPAALIQRLAETAAGVFFAIGLWRRVKPHGVG